DSRRTDSRRTDSRRTDSHGAGWNDPDASDAEGSPDSSFPGAGERVGDDDRARALDAEPAGNATVGDMVDTDAIDSRAHEQSEDVEESVEDDD
ncbi:hypothetical protein, partial [Nocardioides sp. P5_C9_2]